MKKNTIIRAVFLTVDGKTMAFPEGPVDEEFAQELKGEMMERWPSLRGGRDTRMAGHKLPRAEDLRIENGRILFEIERHPGNHNGSTRASVQTWGVDLASGTASVIDETHRQIKPRAKSYTKADARKDAQAVLRILSGRRKNRGELEDNGPGSYTLYACSFADLGQFKRTHIGRRKQFIAALEQVLEPKGWLVSGDQWTPIITVTETSPD